MPAKPAVREPLVPQPPEQELLYLHLPAVYPAELPVKQADTVYYPAVLPVKQADTVRYPEVYPVKQADTVHSPAVYPVKQADTAGDNPAEHSADTAGDNPAEYSVRTAEGSPAEYSADRKADKGYTEVLPQVRLRLL